jgi:alkylation response protein AidB-like acyl-CoA dehydrogenase
MVGPVLIEHGTAEQKKKFLAKILDATEIWCQGFSEPNAGSDLAAVSTKAVAVDGGFRITGQKVWTSFAHIADWCFLLARTGGERHKGLTYFLVEMKSKGISTKPLKQISGDEEFNELFLDEVFVPQENVVGEVGQGWKIAISTLMYERVVLTFARQLQSETALKELLAQKNNVDLGELAGAVVEACAVRALSYKHLLQYVAGARPGPEGSLDKLFWSESFQRLTKLSFKTLGSRGALSEETEGWIHRYLYSRGRTIAAGTSEIQRNIIAERILKLPKEKC